MELWLFCYLLLFFLVDEAEARKKLRKAEDGADVLTSDKNSGRKRKQPKRYITEEGDENFPARKRQCKWYILCFHSHYLDVFLLVYPF